ncbi:MAG: amino acid adenylation domain-containing protein [Thermodesulfobacteriota bacterium]|nr:amino acid adenylation domain-containing protein [Thermodesulfobacteriota bacterium]
MDKCHEGADPSSEELELLRYLLEEEGIKPQRTATIPRRGSVEEVPMSFAQQRLWLLDQLEPESAAYNIAAAFSLTGLLHVAALEHALNALIRRHESLRTTFTEVAGKPQQIISPTLSLELPVIELRELSEAERNRAVRRLSAEEARRLFDLSQGPLLRATLLRMTEQEYVLLLTLHHIVADEWSMEVLFRELAVLYKALSVDRPSPLNALPIQYADFAVWQRQWLQGEELDAQLSYWKDRLADALPSLNLPTDRPRPAMQTFRGSRESRPLLSAAQLQALKALSVEEDATLFMTLLAAFNVLLHRYTGQEDIAVGSPIANRNRIELEGLIGFFLNTLVLRTDLSDDPTFRELLARVRETALEAYAHQDVPFERLVEKLQPERDLSRTPLFQVMFVLRDGRRQTLELSGVTVTPMEVDTGTSKFDLILFVAEGEDGLRGTVEYNTDLFHKTTIARMLGHYERLLEAIVSDPDQRVGALPLLTAPERHQLLVEWNNTRTEYPGKQWVHQLFESQVERTPDAVAVVFGDQQITYDELNRRANRLAWYLRRLGVGPDVLVGICLERSLDMVAALLAVLKAGGGYVPLDPSYPRERLAFMLEDAPMTALFTQTGLLETLPKHGAKTVCLDSGLEDLTREGETNPVNEGSTESLAYVLYTSGSTGLPKGVAMTHRSLSNLICWQVQNSALPEGARTLQFAPLSFDVSFQEIFSTLCSGGALVLISEESRRDPMELLGCVTAKSIERLFLPFVALQQLVEGADGRGTVPAGLREIITAGEPLQITRQVASFFSRLTGCALYNQYGPTESHVVTAFALKGPPGDWPLFPPMGRPIANTQIYLLDKDLQPVPPGVPGELYIAGVGLARGYLHRPELTATAFIPNPFGNDPGSRLYNTGDLARYLPDGNMEFLGRIDSQVKIRGFRVELGEIEAALREHPDLRDAVVVARQDGSADRYLAAYVVPVEILAPTISGLRSFLQERLPDYMIPSAWVMLERLPLTPSGKVNRLTLPAPVWKGPEMEDPFVAPKDPLELQLTQLFEDLLGVQGIGVKSDFFELGGHSLLAVRMFTQIEKAFGKRLPLATLFQAPTVERLAEILRQQGWSAPWSPLVPIQPGGFKQPFFCVHGLGGNVVGYAALARCVGPEQPFYGLQAHGLRPGRAPHTRVEDMAAYYLAKGVQTMQPEGPYLLGGACLGGMVALEMAHQLQAQGHEVALLALIDPDPHLSSLYWRRDFTLLIEDVKRGRLSRATNTLVRKIRKKITQRKGPLQQAGQLERVDAAHRRARHSYIPQVYSGKITFFWCDEESGILSFSNHRVSWRNLARGGLEEHRLPGPHMTMLREPYVQVLGQKLKMCLDEAQKHD